MISKTFLAGVSFLALLLISCGEDTSKQQEKYQAIFKDVLHVHDKLMVRMTDMYEYSKELENIADTSATPEPYVKAEQALKESDDAMMNWMEHFGDEFVKNKSAIKKMNSQQLDVQIEAIKDELESVEVMQTEMT